MQKVRSARSVLVRIGCLVLAVSVALVGAEALGRLVWKVKYNDWLSDQLHGYDVLDRSRSLIVPKADTVITVGQHRRDLKAYNKPVGLTEFEELVQELDLKDDDVVFTINSIGFRGEEIAVPKPEGVFRILAIGDSCTWGSGVETFTYPRFLQQNLSGWVRERCLKKLEVVNGGVPGYNFERVLKRTDEYLAIDPDLVTIYLGWNRTIGRADVRKNQRLYRRFALYRFYYHAVVNRTDTGITEDFNKSTFFDRQDASLRGFEHYDFSTDISDLARLVDRFRDQDIDVVLVTLAGLLDWRVDPDERALEVAYPISSTNNLAAYAVLTRKFNTEIREFAEFNKTPLIDFEQYAYEVLNPRSVYFSDSVHPTLIGYQKMGEFLAYELVGLIKCD